MRKTIKIINNCGEFGIMVDEGSDSSNTGLLSSAIRQCYERLDCNECWLEHNAIDKIKSQTVIDGLKVRLKFEVSHAHVF